MKHQAVSQLLFFAGLLLLSLATSSMSTAEDETIHIAVGNFNGEALQRLADDAKKHGASQTQVTVICTLSSFHLGQSCRKIYSLESLLEWFLIMPS